MGDLLDLLGHVFLLEAVRGPSELVKAVVEIVGDVGARFPPRLGRLGGEIGVKVGRQDGLACRRVDGVSIDVELRGVPRSVIRAGSIVGLRRNRACVSRGACF